MFSLLGGFFQNINNWVTTNVGSVGISILIIMLTICDLFILSNIFAATTKLAKPKLVLKWGQLLLLIVFTLAIIWLCTAY